MKITKVDCHVLLIPDFNSLACSSAQDNLVVEIHTDQGITGIGETDTNPWIARECIRATGTHAMGLGLEEMLLGCDPLQPEAIWQKLYSGSKMNGRRGALICALGAIDMALWDIKGKAFGVPIHTLLGGAVKTHFTPYASLLPAGDTLSQYRSSLIEKLLQAQAFGFSAAKLEVCISGPYSHNGIQEKPEEVIEIVGQCRQLVGPDFVLMLDVAYAWPDAKAALRIINQLAAFDLFFVETPIDIDDLEGYAYLHNHSPIRIAAGEWQNTYFEFADLAERGKLDVLQPDVGRVGGFSQARKVIDIASAHGRLVVPHCWKTGIGIAASAHLSATAFCSPYIEFLPAELSESALRRELVIDELKLENGKIAIPQKPGLGVELSREAIEKYAVS
jgi:L-alanine-DL-glutamate epimerase-like enolase superfamily enzyme